ncbi:MAG: PAS domain S-box protein [Thermodesulfobacteriota bacterium]
MNKWNIIVQSKNEELPDKVREVCKDSKQDLYVLAADNDPEFFRLCREKSRSVAIRDLSELEVQEGLTYLSGMDLEREGISIPVLCIVSPEISDAVWLGRGRVHVGDFVQTPLRESELGIRVEKLLEQEGNRREHDSKSGHFRDMLAASFCAEERSLLDSIQYQAGIAFFGYHFEGEKLFYTNVLCDLLECSQGEIELNRENLEEYVHHEDRDILMRALKDLERSGSLDLVVRYYKKDGELRYARLLSEVRMVEGGKQALGLVQDITNTRRVENTLSDLLQQSKYFREIVEQTADGILINDAHGYIQYVNPAFENITGYEKNEAQGRKPFFWLHNSNLEKADKKRILEVVSRGQKWNQRVQGMRRDRGGFEIDVSISPVYSKQGEISNFVAVIRDMTEKLSLEHQLRQAQKMEAVGTLAGGIAHDFNNILMAIIGYSEMIMRRLDSDSKEHEYTESIMNAGIRGKRLVQQILSFSRQSGSEIRPLQVEPLIKEDIKLLQATLPSNISLETRIEGDFDPVKADPSDMHQMVMNLCTNAIQAMEENGGELFLELEEIEFQFQFNKRQNDMQPGKYLKLTVRDTGEGMDRSTLDRIFDPFYTTRGPDKGTGLGLSVVHGIVNKLGGTIQVDSEPGQGSLFSIFLPAVDNATGSESSGLEEDSSISSGRGRILFVDDELDILTWGRETLQILGYNVVACGSSLEAWEIFKNAPDAFELVVTDQKMPDMNGIELASRIKGMRSNIPVLLSTGYGENLMSSDDTSGIVDKMLEKPFSMGWFSRAVKSLITSREDSKIQ